MSPSRRDWRHEIAPYGKLLGSDGAGNGEGGVFAMNGLVIDDDFHIDPMKDGVEGFVEGAGVAPMVMTS